MVSDHQLLKWFALYARETPSFQEYLSNPIQSLSLPSLDLNNAVVSATSSQKILDAMRLMSEKGVSSIAVVEDGNGTLLSAVSVTDIGKIVVPSQSNQILTTPLHDFIAHIKDSDGISDGADKYPVYSVFPSSLLSFTMEKLLATNAHRVFVTKELTASPVMSPSSHSNLTGIVSIVDILSLFARIAKIPNIDPTQMQRQRRASSASTSDRGLSRSSSTTSIRQSPIILASSSPILSPIENARNSVTAIVLDPLQVGAQRKDKRRSVVEERKGG
jgi:CBS domain-containing protein